MKKSLSITVMMGGPSAEREVSLRSGAAVARALRERGHHVDELDPKLPGWILPAGTEVVFLALHGTYGEDGTIQTELERLGVPYTGCGPEASRLAFDKILAKKKFLSLHLPTPRFQVISSLNTVWPEGWDPPVVLKPARQGSSVGLQFVQHREEWPAALAAALALDDEVLLEEKIDGREVTVGILGQDALPLVEVRPKRGPYDYQNKYTAGATEYFCPAPFEPVITRRLQEAGLKAFQALGGRDYGRVDVMVRSGADPFVLEVNTLPGMTETSLLPKAAAAAGYSYGALCEKMIEFALLREPGQHETMNRR